MELVSPKTIKDIQKLTGRVAALNRFISRSSERCKPFYDLLRKNTDFVWTKDHESTFHDLKSYLSSPPLLAKTIKDEPLSLYLSVTEFTVSAVLANDIAGLQTPVCYVSKILLPAVYSFCLF